MYDVNGYRLTIVQSTIEGEDAYLIKAEPINPFGYMFYGYRTLSEAEDVIDNLRKGSFDDQVYRVNFAPDNGKFFRKNKP